MNSMEQNNSRSVIRRRISIIFFDIYICVLIYFLFFAENMGRTGAARDYSYNLVPFKEISRFISYRETLGLRAVWMNIAGNVAAFIPFGIFIIPVSGRKFGFAAAMFAVFDVSLCVEIIQLVTRVGSFDVDDLILNTLGGLAGILIYKLFIRIERNKSDGKA